MSHCLTRSVSSGSSVSVSGESEFEGCSIALLGLSYKVPFVFRVNVKHNYHVSWFKYDKDVMHKEKSSK